MTRSLIVKLCLLTAFVFQIQVYTIAGPKLQRVFYSYDASYGLADNSAQTIKCTKTGRMVVTTIGHINFYYGDAFSHIDPTSDDMFPLPKYTGHYRLYFDCFHHIWLKDKYTVTCVDLMTERFVANVDSVIRSLGMERQVDDLFADVNCHLWMMSGKELVGINTRKTIPVWLDDELQDVDVYNHKKLLQFFANSTVSVFDIETGQHEYDAVALEPAEAARYTNSSVVYSDSNLYYQIRNGDKDAVLLCFDIKSREWKKLLQTPYHLNNMVIHRGRLFVASEYGYWTLNLKNGSAEHTEELLLTQGRKLNTDINTICFDRQGGMWLGTERRGLLYSRPYKIPFVSYTWDDPEAGEYAQMMDRQPQQTGLPRHVNCEFVDSRGWVWTGTYTGLRLKKPGSTHIRVFNRQDGLLNEMVHSVIEDNQHDMWIATSYGISHLYVRGDSIHQIETFTSMDNVPSESFVNGRAMKLDDGTIVMQSLDHVVAFHPTNFYEGELSHMRLYPKLIRMMVNGDLINAGTMLDGRMILDRAITRAKEVTLNYDQNTISLTFSGLNFMRPSQTYYRIRVRGLDEKWKVLSYANSDGQVDSHGMLHLILTDIPPGTYEIDVQVSMSPDTWPVEPFTWTVRVEQPWWRSTGIYIALVTLLLLVMLGNFIYFMRNTRLRILRNNEENDLLRRLESFAKRCDGLSGEVLTPISTSAEENADIQYSLDKDFEKAMLSIIPYLHEHREERVNMRQLSALTGIEIGRLYEVLSANLYKSPRQLALKLRLQEALQMLLESDMTIEDIAERYRFVSPNYFIASFYHYYRQTPLNYRNSIPR